MIEPWLGSGHANEEDKEKGENEIEVSTRLKWLSVTTFLPT
jgi:hypothetical protein